MVVTRIVKKDGKVVRVDRFISVYEPKTEVVQGGHEALVEQADDEHARDPRADVRRARGRAVRGEGERPCSSLNSRRCRVRSSRRCRPSGSHGLLKRVYENGPAVPQEVRRCRVRPA